MHDGHRQRLRRRIIKEGTDAFEAHQLLEALLFYSIPRMDTNETAHRLIDRFGSLEEVFSASFEQLMSVSGIGVSSAVQLKIIGGINRKIALQDHSVGYSFNTIGKICDYLAGLYVGVSVERIYMLAFNNAMNLIDSVHICDGTVNAAVMQPRILIEKALYRQASAVVVAHNHPKGIAVPSGDDISTTEMLRKAFDIMGIQFLEHVIIAGKSYTPIMKKYNMGINNGESYIVSSEVSMNRFYNGDSMGFVEVDAGEFELDIL